MIVIGVDEAGRGPLVGSVVAGAVILPDGFYLPELTDSKKLSEKKRQALFQEITQSCQWAVGEVDANTIDKINILQATLLAMKKAVENLNTTYDRVLVDGNQSPDVKNCTTIVKGDLTEPCISAASIVAKVTRDRQMIELDKRYPEYGFAKHKGYGTKAHLQALEQYGAISGEHRYSFKPIKRFLN